jgi:hypothetical protein
MNAKKLWFVLLTQLLVATVLAGSEDPDLFDLEDPYLFDLMDVPNYKASWDKMISSDNRVDSWLQTFSQTLDGVASPNKSIKLSDGASYTFGSVCKPHECGSNFLNVLFAPDGSNAWGYYLSEEEVFFLGNPTPEITAILKEDTAP